MFTYVRHALSCQGETEGAASTRALFTTEALPLGWGLGYWCFFYVHSEVYNCPVLMFS